MIYKINDLASKKVLFLMKKDKPFNREGLNHSMSVFHCSCGCFVKFCGNILEHIQHSPTSS